ncbi:unnamed protein product [Owenia fusiformis]|uniref:Uncharacterized protein n=1 Tax=Owenia fusiformis TaxID=6347 RepID=A0A8S4PL36_OWEFU|nr:unnamed protein product [Owenia fusiformis]
MAWILHCLLNSILILPVISETISQTEYMVPQKEKTSIGKHIVFESLPIIPENHKVTGVAWVMQGYHGNTEKIQLELDDQGELVGLGFSGQHPKYTRYGFQKVENQFSLNIYNTQIIDSGTVMCIITVEGEEEYNIETSGRLVVVPGKTKYKRVYAGDDVIIRCEVPSLVPLGWKTHWVRIWWHDDKDNSKMIYMASFGQNVRQDNWTRFDSTKYELLNPKNDKVFDLRIKDVQASDTGFYVCNIAQRPMDASQKVSDDKNLYFPIGLKLKEDNIAGKKKSRLDDGTDKVKCKCRSPKPMLEGDGETLFTNGLNCGSRVEWRCRDQSLPVYTEPVASQKCVNGVWEPEFEGLPWCVFYTKEDPCKEFIERDICKAESKCIVEGETSDAKCICKPNTNGVFCQKQTE